MASAWGSHLQQVVGVPVSLACDSGGGQKGRAVGGGMVPSRWAEWQWPFVCVRKQVVRLTYFPICWLGVPGLGGRTAHVVLQE